jgi:homocysteine S-methyltransferase
MGDPEVLGSLYRGMRDQFPQISVLGGCCGTDHRHVGAICRACVAVTRS